MHDKSSLECRTIDCVDHGVARSELLIPSCSVRYSSCKDVLCGTTVSEGTFVCMISITRLYQSRSRKGCINGLAFRGKGSERVSLLFSRELNETLIAAELA